MGVAYHSNYLVWFEVGRTSYCRACGVAYAAMEKEAGAFLPVVEVRCRYRTPLRYDDSFLVRTWIERLQTRVVSFGYQIVDPEGTAILAEGWTRHVVTDRDGRPKRLPDRIHRLLRAIPENLAAGAAS